MIFSPVWAFGATLLVSTNNGVFESTVFPFPNSPLALYPNPTSIPEGSNTKECQNEATMVVFDLYFGIWACDNSFRINKQITRKTLKIFFIVNESCTKYSIVSLKFFLIRQPEQLVPLESDQKPAGFNS